MSTNFNDWISQAEAARIKGVTRQAIHKLVQSGRLASQTVAGHILVNRKDLEQFQPQPAGRPKSEESRDVEKIKRLISSCNETERREILRHLREKFPIHSLESKLGLNAEAILEAIDRSAELTIRMFRGVLAEATFETYVVKNLVGWTSLLQSKATPLTAEGGFFDFLLKHGDSDPIRVQVKLQRSAKSMPWRSENVPKKYEFDKGFFVVETHRTRGGENRKTKEKTRPYHFGQFDILAVAMQPSTKRWDSFKYTVGNWLIPSTKEENLIEIYQPVSEESNDDWTDDFETCVSWFKEGRKKTIRKKIETG